MAKSRKKPESNRGGARPGAGRKKKYEGQTTIVSLQLPNRLLDRIERDAAKAEQSRNETIVGVLAAHYFPPPSS